MNLRKGITAAAFLLAFATNAVDGQGRRVAGAPTSTASSAQADSANPNFSISTLNLRRDAVRQWESQLGAVPEKTNFSVRRVLNGNKKQAAAAQGVLAATAQSIADPNTTVVVVVGNEDDRNKVIQSLTAVTRQVRVAFVDKSFSDASHDNSVLEAGVVGMVAGQATNVQVFLPSNGSPVRDKPNHVLCVENAVTGGWVNASMVAKR